MAWFRNGRKYWKHNGKIYSCRAKKHYNSSPTSSIKSTNNGKYKYNFKYKTEIERYKNDLINNEDAWMDALDSLDTMPKSKKYNHKDNYDQIMSEYEKEFENSMSEPI